MKGGKKDSIKLFEISDIYSKDKELKQQKKLGLIISGRQGHNYNNFQKNLTTTISMSF